MGAGVNPKRYVVLSLITVLCIRKIDTGTEFLMLMQWVNIDTNEIKRVNNCIYKDDVTTRTVV